MFQVTKNDPAEQKTYTLLRLWANYKEGELILTVFCLPGVVTKLNAASIVERIFNQGLMEGKLEFTSDKTHAYLRAAYCDEGINCDWRHYALIDIPTAGATMRSMLLRAIKEGELDIFSVR